MGKVLVLHAICGCTDVGAGVTLDFNNQSLI